MPNNEIKSKIAQTDEPCETRNQKGNTLLRLVQILCNGREVRLLIHSYYLLGEATSSLATHDQRRSFREKLRCFRQLRRGFILSWAIARRCRRCKIRYTRLYLRWASTCRFNANACTSADAFRDTIRAHANRNLQSHKSFWIYVPRILLTKFYFYQKLFVLDGRSLPGFRSK